MGVSRSKERARDLSEQHGGRITYAQLLRVGLTRDGPLELDFLLLLEAKLLALPRFNVRLHGILVDVYWKELGLVLELDGSGNHGTTAQKRRDVNYMEILRGHGLSVERFDWWDVHTHTRQVLMLAKLAELGVRR
jgi:very-short-patch-repair endonuclease